jgi:hypothetical protein
VEIGPQAQVVEDRYGIRVIRQPLRAGSLDERFDGVYSYGCLEHIEDLAEFFAASRSCLAPRGVFFHSVPNSKLSFDRVHLDHLLHEHINYFTPENAVALLEAQGFHAADATLTRAGNELMISGYYEPAAVSRWPAARAPKEARMLADYAAALERKMQATLVSLRAMTASGRSVALYAGGFEYGFHLSGDGVRYVDGDVYKHGKRWLRGLPPIEPPETLVDRPVDHIVVCKPHYFGPIRDALTGLGIESARILSIDALCS